MMKRLLPYLFLWIVCSVNAQNWDLIQQNQEHIFRYCRPIDMDYLHYWSSDSTHFANCFHSLAITGIDTVLGQDTLFLLNPEIDTIGIGGGFVDLISAPHQLFQEKMLKTASGDYYFLGQDTFLVKTQAILNERWPFSQADSATLVLIDTMTILGQLDSVKIALLDNGDSLAWGKENGLIKFPSGSAMHADLVGIQSATTNLGLEFADFWETYNFEIGDVFMYENYHFIGSAWISECISRNKVTVTGKQQLSDRFIYTYDIVGNGSCTSCGFPTVFLYDSTHPTEQYSNRMLTYHQVLPVTANYLYNIFYNIDSLGAYKISFYRGFPAETRYRKNLGETYSLHVAIGSSQSCTLIGYVKNGDTTGIVLADSVILANENSVQKIQTFNVFPIPAQDYVQFEIPNTAHQIQVYNAQGSLLAQEVLSNQARIGALQLKDFANGVYFLVLLDEQGTKIAKTSIVIQR